MSVRQIQNASSQVNIEMALMEITIGPWLGWRWISVVKGLMRERYEKKRGTCLYVSVCVGIWVRIFVFVYVCMCLGLGMCEQINKYGREEDDGVKERREK